MRRIEALIFGSWFAFALLVLMFAGEEIAQCRLRSRTAIATAAGLIGAGKRFYQKIQTLVLLCVQCAVMSLHDSGPGLHAGCDFSAVGGEAQEKPQLAKNIGSKATR
ncbi:MAG TPA: hypothetical protein VIF60_01850 [Burkholderiaceae bacterium]